MKDFNFAEKVDYGQKLLELKNKIIEQMESHIKDESLIPNLKKNVTLIKMLGANGSGKIDPAMFSRAIKWGELSEKDLKDNKESYSVGIKSFKKLHSGLEKLNDLDPASLEQLLRSTESKTPDNSHSAIQQFVGEYKSFHPDLEEGKYIIEGELSLKPHQSKPNELVAEYISHDRTIYKGKCEILSDCLYIIVKDSKLIIHNVAHVGVRLDLPIKLIHCSCTSIDNHGNPVSFSRIFLSDEYLALYKDSVIAYLRRERHWQPTRNLTLEDIQKENQEKRLKEPLKTLADTFFVSFNHFAYWDNKRKDLSINAWQFYEENDRLFVERKGAYFREFKGEAFMIDREHIAILLHVTKEKGSNNKRLYIGRPVYIEDEEEQVNRKKIKEIRLLGLTYNRQNEVIAGREILIPQSVVGLDEIHPEMTNYEGLQNRSPHFFKQVLSFLENGENATFPFFNTNHSLTAQLEGIYRVYYLNSKTGKLRCNVAVIAKEEGHYSFNYQSEETKYTTISTFKNEEIIHIQLKDGRQNMKDERQNMYFSFHLTYEKGIRLKDKINILTGTFSSIGYSANKPASGRIIFIRDEDNDLNKCLSQMKIFENIQPSSSEKNIEDYLKLNSIGPIVANPISDFSQLESVVEDRKLSNLEEWKDRIIPSINPDLQHNYSGFVEGLIEFINRFIIDGIVPLEARYVPMYRIFYDEFLRSLAGSDGTFYATSIARKNYFWYKDSTTENETNKYVSGKGKMKRIFFVEAIDGVPDEEEQTIIKRHFTLYGEDPNKGAVYICDSRQIPNHLFYIFCTDTHTGASWKIFTTLGKEINKFQIETEEKTHHQLLSHFEEIERLTEITQHVTQDLIDSWEQ